METFKSVDSFTINKGKVFVVENTKDRLRDDNGLVGQQVIIDNKIVTVNVVESHCIKMIYEGHKIALLV